VQGQTMDRISRLISEPPIARSESHALVRRTDRRTRRSPITCIAVEDVAHLLDERNAKNGRREFAARFTAQWRNPLKRQPNY
jgi:hypothetical protein